MVSQATTTSEAQPEQRPGFRFAWVRKGWIPLLALLWVAALLLVGPFVAPHDPAEQNLLMALQPPAWSEGGSMTHPLGTDHLGRDVLSRVIAGGRLSILVGLIGVAGAAAIGTLLGGIAGYFGGVLDALIGRAIEVAMALPAMLLALLLAAFLEAGLSAIIFILIVVGWMGYARVVRAEVLLLRSQDYVSYARVIGVRAPFIMLRHLLPNVMNSVMILATLQIGAVIIFESTLSFLGLGIQAPDVSWGLMLASGRDYINSAWWLSVLPGLMIVVTVLLSNITGEWARDRLDPRLRQLL